jgi:hypothetical protein
MVESNGQSSRSNGAGCVRRAERAGPVLAAIISSTSAAATAAAIVSADVSRGT